MEHTDFPASFIHTYYQRGFYYFIQTNDRETLALQEQNIITSYVKFILMMFKCSMNVRNFTI